jgi:PQQ-dependent catabolism-associated CXXCW motif protein
MKRQFASIVFIVALAAACAPLQFNPSHQESLMAGVDPGLTALLNQDGKLGFEKFRSYSGPHKAFVICMDGVWSWVQKRESPEKAIEAALTLARRNSGEAPCRPYAVDSQFIGAGPSIRVNVDEARVALAAVELKKKFYWDEERETNIPPTTLVNRIFHAPTPPAIPGAKVIFTTDLKQMLSSSDPPLLINVLLRPNFSIPGSVANNGIGSAFSSKGEFDAQEFLGRHLKEKNRPVVFYCLSWQCWLSYNAALRATSWGYSNVYWYRGGVYSWFDAELPFVLEQ